MPACSDGKDNDHDGKFDFPEDLGCVDENSNNEGATIRPQCSDNRDDDGRTDYSADESCKAAGDASENCVTSEKPINVITRTVTTGTTAGATNDYNPTCNSPTGLAPDLLYRIELPAMGVLNLNVTGFDTVTTVLDSTCAGTPIRCSDPQNLAINNLAAGTYYVTIEGYGTTTGAFTLTTSGTIAPGGSCEGALFKSGVIACEPGVQCQGPPDARICPPTQCSDGLDNNNDGLIDYPADPGCTSLKDPLENTVCPGATCPACFDTIDNDSDGLIDYPADPACRSASGASELCSTSEPVPLITSTVTLGTTAGAANDYDPTCNSTTGLAPDVFYRLDVPTMATLKLDVAGFDTVTTILNSTCGGTPIRCSDPQSVTLTNVAAGTYYVGIEGYATTSGAFTMTTTGTVAPDQSCEGALFQSGAFTCTAGFACNGPLGARRCTVAQCNDGTDNNGDGKIDYPADPGCTSTGDNSEDTVCPGPTCPECADGIDNDGDTRIDYPADPSCTAASGPSEMCTGEDDPILPITAATTVDTLVGAINDHSPSCGSTGGADRVFTLDIPALATLTLDTEGSTITDTVLSFLNSTCNEPSIECDDDDGSGFLSFIMRTNVPAGRYYVVVDAYNTTTTLAPFHLNVAGTVAPGASCEGPLFQNGVLTCTSGYVCGGPPGARTCNVQ
jgi:large repetitive protein